MHVVFFLLLCGILTCYSVLVIDLKRKSAAQGVVSETRIPAWIFTAWFVGAVFWGGRFLTIRVPGLFDITIERLLFLLVLGSVVHRMIRREKRSGQEDFLTEVAMGFLLILCLISMAIHGFRAPNPGMPDPWFLFLSGYLFPAIVYVFFRGQNLNLDLLEHIFWCFFGVGCYVAFLAYLEFFGLREYVYPRYINDPKIWLHLDRARGPFLNAGINGLIIVQAFLCGVYLYASKKPLRWILGPLVLAMIPTIYFCQTRSVYLAFLVCAVALATLLKVDLPKWKILALPTALVVFLAIGISPRLLSPDRRAGGVYQVEEVKIRLILIERSFEMILERPFLGHGFGQFLRVASERFRGRYPIPGTAEEQVQHHHLLGLWAELGIMGVTVYALIMLRGLTRGVVVISKKTLDERTRNLALVCVLGLVAYLLNNNFLEPGYFLPYNAAAFTFLASAENLYVYALSLHSPHIPTVWGTKCTAPSTA
ncbi:O-antigen ligase family protein [Desulfosoma sp.]